MTRSRILTSQTIGKLRNFRECHINAPFSDCSARCRGCDASARRRVWDSGGRPQFGAGHPSTHNLGRRKSTPLWWGRWWGRKQQSGTCPRIYRHFGHKVPKPPDSDGGEPRWRPWWGTVAGQSGCPTSSTAWEHFCRVGLRVLARLAVRPACSITFGRTNNSCRRQIEKSPLAQIEMSLSTVLVGEYWADRDDGVTPISTVA